MTDKRTISVWELNTLSGQEREQLLQRTESDMSEYLQQVSPIIEDVRQRGDVALAEYGRRFDGADISEADLQVTLKSFRRRLHRLTGTPGKPLSTQQIIFAVIMKRRNPVK